MLTKDTKYGKVCIEIKLVLILDRSLYEWCTKKMSTCMYKQYNNICMCERTFLKRGEKTIDKYDFNEDNLEYNSEDNSVLPNNGTDTYYNEEIYQNVQKIGIGELLSYKDMCVILNQPRYSGNQKKAQLKEFLRYFDFEKVDKKYIVKDIYDTPLPPELKLPANSIYSIHIKIILLSYLLRHDLDKPVYISSQKLYLALGMVNQSYISMYNQKALLRNEIRAKCKFSEIEDKTLNFYIKNFYERCRVKFSSIIKSSLDSLKKQNYIDHSRSYHIYKRVLDENDNEIEIYDGNYSTEAETADIMEIERNVMDYFGFQYESEIWLRGKTEEYWNKVIEEIQELYPEIHKIYRAHKIICTRNNVIKALSKEQTTAEMKQLNEKILNYIDTQAANKYEAGLSEGDYTKRYSQKYLDAQYYLSDRLIKLKD